MAIGPDDAQFFKARMALKSVRPMLPSEAKILMPTGSFREYMTVVTATAPDRSSIRVPGNITFNSDKMDAIPVDPVPGPRGPAEVIVANGGKPGMPDWDPSLPINMAVPEPEYMERVKEARPEAEPYGPYSEEVDLSDPSATPSFLVPTGLDRALGGPTVSQQGYPATSPSGVPPDVDITAGKDYVIQGYNSYYQVNNKSGGYVTRFNMRTLFASLPFCGAITNSLCDPQVLYDEDAAGACPTPTDTRYILVALATDGATTPDGRICVAVSKSGLTPTATANFWVYEIDVDPGAAIGLPDYPHGAAGADAIFIGYNHFGDSYGDIVALNKTKMYAGNPLLAADSRVYNFGTTCGTGGNCSTPQPAEVRGCKQSQWPTGTYGPYHYGLITNPTTSAGYIWRWAQPTLSNNPTIFASPTISSPSLPINPNGAAYTVYPIDALGTRWMDAELRWPYLWGVRAGLDNSFTWDAVQMAKIKLDVATPTATTEKIVEAAASTHNWMPDGTPDSQQNYAVVYNRASTVGPVFVGGYITGRNNATSTWGSPITVQTGKRRYTTGGLDTSGTYYRWGDYNGAAIDPEDGCTVWSNVQYVRNTTTEIQDGSWVATFKFSDCVPGTVRRADLSKADYFCVDNISASITDSGGAPTNAVYHTGHSTVSATISGGPGTYTVSATTIAALSAVNGDEVWLTFTGSDSNPYSSAHSAVDCTLAVCAYQIDPLGGGCDYDLYHDKGETHNYWVALWNADARDVPGEFTAELALRSPNGYINLINNISTYPALQSNYYAYNLSDPFVVKYTAPLTTCNQTLPFTVQNIGAPDGSWWADTAACALEPDAVPYDFDRIGNYSPGGTFQFTQNFDSAWDSTAPPTGWTIVNNTGSECPWASDYWEIGRGNFTGGSGDCASADSDACGSGTNISSELASPTFDMTGYATGSLTFKHDAFDYSSGTVAQVQASTDGGSTWPTNLATYTACTTTQPGYCCDMITPQPGTVALSLAAIGNGANRKVRFHYTGAWQCWWQVDDVSVWAGAAGCETNNACAPAPVLEYLSYDWDDSGNGCNNNGIMDPGELGILTVYLYNSGDDVALNTSATLTCPTCPAGVQICDGSADYGNILFGTGYGYGPNSVTGNTFQVYIPPSVSCLTALPFVISATATNPYSVVLSPTTIKVGGPPKDNYDTDTPLISYEDHFRTEPETAGALGRVGFTTAWTMFDANGAARANLAAVSSLCSDSDGDGSVVQAAVSKGSAATRFAHTFSTVVPAGQEISLITVAWEWHRGALTTADTYTWEFSDDAGATWTILYTQTGSTTASAWSCLMATDFEAFVLSKDPAAVVKNNPNMMLRWGWPNVAGAKIDNIQVHIFGYKCAASTCSATCPTASNPPAVPDGQSGQPFKITKNAGTPANVDFSWDPGCTGDTDYQVVWGNLNTLGLASGVTNGTVTYANCALGTTGAATNKVPPTVASGEGYFAVIDGVTGSSFGRHGNNTDANERLLSGDTGLCTGVTTKDITRTSCSAKSSGIITWEPPTTTPNVVRVPAAGHLEGIFSHCADCNDSSSISKPATKTKRASHNQAGQP